MSFLKADNIKLKEQVEDLEKRIANLAGSMRIFSSGMPGHEQDMSSQIMNLITSVTDEMKIVVPYITQEYSMILLDRAKNNIKVQIVTNDRRFWPAEHQKVYDVLKVTRNINLVNLPGVYYLMVLTAKEAIVSSAPLDKNILTKSILIGFLIKERIKLEELGVIFKEMLPSFMR
jgi:hypothetical protein